MTISRSRYEYVVSFFLLYLCLAGCNKEIDNKRERQLDRSQISFPSHLLSVNSAGRYARDFESIGEFQLVLSAALVLDGYEDILRLWFRGFHDIVELMWYKKDDRVSRTLIMALVLINQEDDRLYSFLHVCDRFEKEERQLRREEIIHIARNREKYSNMISELELKIDELAKKKSRICSMH